MTYQELIKAYKAEANQILKHKLLIRYKDILITQTAYKQQKEIAQDLEITTSKLSNTIQILKAL